MKTLRRFLWVSWCAAVIAAMIGVRLYRPNVAPPTEKTFSELHRVCYDVYSVADLGQAYDLLAVTFAGRELDKQFCLYAKAGKQLEKAAASVVVWDLSYQDFKVVDVAGDRCHVYSKWNVVYYLSHEKHSHVRSNVYEVLFELAKNKEGWKIVNSRILSDTNVS